MSENKDMVNTPKPDKKGLALSGLGLVTAIIAAMIIGAVIMSMMPFSAQQYVRYQKQELEETGELAWYIQSFNYEDVSLDALYSGAFNGMVAALNDKYAAYYTDEQYESLLETHNGQYVGIGATFAQEDDGSFIIKSIIPNSPADRSGILSGDAIIAIDGQDILDKTSDQVIEKIQSHKDGQEFTITLLRDNEEIIVNIMNEEIINHRVHVDKNEDVTVIQLDEFNGKTVVEEFKEALIMAEEDGSKGVVIDLRDNPGGDLLVVLDIADALMDEGIVLTMEDNKGEITEYKSEKGKLTSLPLAVIINHNSASASEVLAGALKDRDYAEVFGLKSFGKGIVQSIYPLNVGTGYIKLTAAVYMTPNGTKLHGVGIEPDRTVFLPLEYKDAHVSEIPRDQDTQIQAAVDYINGLDTPIS